METDVTKDKYITTTRLSVSHAHSELLPHLTDSNASLTAMVLSISLKLMDHASSAVTVTFQTQAEPDVLRQTPELQEMLLAVPEKEKSTTRIEPSASNACHTPELRDLTASAFQINAMPAKSSLGSEHAPTALMDLDQTPTEEAALAHHLFD